MYAIRGIDESGKERAVASGAFDEPPNQNRMLQLLPERGAELWIIEWTSGLNTCRNHFVTGEGPYDFETWRRWNDDLNGIYGVKARER